jgi:cytochrome P450
VKATRQIADLPGPRRLPLLGNALELDIPRLHQILEAWAAEHGPVFRFGLGPRTIVAVADPALIEEVLRRRPESFRRFRTIEPMFAELGIAGVFSTEGEAWRPQRRLTMEALAHRHLRGFFPTLRAVAAKLLRRLSGHPAGATLDIVDDFKRFTVDTTTLLAFGYDVNTLEREDDPIHQLIAQIFPAFARRMNAVVPYWRLVRLPRDRRLDRTARALRAWLVQHIEAARARHAADPGREPGNFLEAMVAARDAEGRPFDDELIYGNAITMLLAGEDTTAHTLTWAIHLLLDHPEVAARLRAEADDVFGGAELPASVEDVNRLTYAGAVANETMRLRPVAPNNFNETVTDLVLGDLFLPKGTPVFLAMRPATVDEARFADARTFRPERWLEPTTPHDARVHMPFGNGPRICPGRSLALLELRLVLAAIARAYDFTRVGDPTRVREIYSFTMIPEGVTVKLSPRRAEVRRDQRAPVVAGDGLQ